MRMTTDDEALAQAAARGDGQAFRLLLERHYDRMRRTALGVLGDWAAAEDVVQDTCLALPAKIRSFNGRSRFTTWLHKVIVNACRDAMRRRATRWKAAEAFADVDALRRAGHAARAAEVAWLAAAMTELKPDLRETALLVLDAELTHAEAGEALGVSEGTVSWRMGGVKRSLRMMAAAEGGRS
jgi:RNA polymerase sigma-70 factor (ECF subfamily)